MSYQQEIIGATYLARAKFLLLINKGQGPVIPRDTGVAGYDSILRRPPT